MATIEPFTTQYFAGDWDWDSSHERFAVLYEAVRFGPIDHAGSATPVVTRDVLETIVMRENHRNRLVPDSDQIVWVGDQICAHRNGDPDSVIWVEPSPDGTFDLAPLGYTWNRIEWDHLFDETWDEQEGK
jgi:hypothetical protein